MGFQSKLSLINGVAYDWASITLTIGGSPIMGITNISYSEDMSVVNYSNHSPFASKQGYGKMNYSASVTLDQYEVSTLQAFAISGQLSLTSKIPSLSSSGSQASPKPS